ncbi:MAG: hypothetical protein ACI4KM_10830 [Oscillospiraceae bacterium]
MKSNTKTVILIIAVIAALAGITALIIKLTSPTDADRLNDRLGATEDISDTIKDNGDDGEIVINRGTASEDSTSDEITPIENEPVESDIPSTTNTTPENTETNSDEPITTTAATTKDSTPTPSPVTEETHTVTTPAVTTAATTTTGKPSENTEPVEEKPSSNDYPDNPSSGDEYVDEDGQVWIYNGIARRWIAGGPTTVQTAPSFTPSGNVILN